MLSPLISVIIPVFNTPPEYLTKCTDSVLNQTYANIEVLLVDDGSFALVESLCIKLSHSDHRIRLYRQDNQGVSSARNLGLREATGDYVTFVDSDDELSPRAVERLVALANKVNADVVCAQYSERKDKLDLSYEDSPEVISGKEAAVRLLYGQQLPTGPFAKLFNRQAINDQSFDTSLTIAEDLHFNFHVLCSSDRVVIDQCALYWYNNLTADSASRGEFKPTRMDGLKSLVSVKNTTYARNDDTLLKATQYRLYMEALFTMIAIRGNEHHQEYWQECLEVMRETRLTCLSNPRVKISDKIFVIISLLNASWAVRLYALKRWLKSKLVV